MKIFITWSGDRGLRAAVALREWLPLILPPVRPWVSDRDIAAGSRWNPELSRQLEDANYGLAVLTPGHLESPWILFESGALSKMVAQSALCPYLVGVEVSEVVGPLGHFQAKKAEKAPTLELLKSINLLLEPAQREDEARIERRLNGMWPELETSLRELPSDRAPVQPRRDQGEILEELVQSIRGMDIKVSTFATQFAPVAAKVAVATRPFSGSITVKVDGVFPKHRTGMQAGFSTGPRMLELVARIFGLVPTEFGSTWFLRDSKTDAVMDREAVALLAAEAISEGARTVTLSSRGPEPEIYEIPAEPNTSGPSQ